jgi:hypothetical protein
MGLVSEESGGVETKHLDKISQVKFFFVTQL